MLKLVVVLSFLAACSAAYDFGLSEGNSFYVDVGNKYIKIASQKGDVVSLTVDNYYGYNGPQNIWVQFYGPGVPQKATHYLDKSVIYSPRLDSDILYKIFKNYEGHIDESQYDKLLKVLHDYVQNGQIHPAVLYALYAVSGQYQVLNYFDSYQCSCQEGLHHQTPYHQELGSLYGERYESGYNHRYGINSYDPRYEVGDNRYNSMYGIDSEYPVSRLGYNQGRQSDYYNNVDQYSRGQYGYPGLGGVYNQQYPYYGSRSSRGAYQKQYPELGYQYGKGLLVN